MNLVTIQTTLEDHTPSRAALCELLAAGGMSPAIKTLAYITIQTMTDADYMILVDKVRTAVRFIADKDREGLTAWAKAEKIPSPIVAILSNELSD